MNWTDSGSEAQGEAGDQSPEAIEAYVRAAVRQMPDKSRVSLLAGVALILCRKMRDDIWMG